MALWHILGRGKSSCGQSWSDISSGTWKKRRRWQIEKALLARILKHLVTEFRDCPIKDIEEKYIEGEPKVTINTVPVAPDLTNAVRKVAKKNTAKIKGDRNEDSSDTEGMITFDILFRAIVPATGETIALIINLEPQRTVYTGYSLVRRGIYYACRMISSQKEVEFKGEDFDSIKKVYTIWLVSHLVQKHKNNCSRCSQMLGRGWRRSGGYAN